MTNVTYIAELHVIDGSTMMTIPPALLDLLSRKNGANVSLVMDGDQLTILSCRPRYTAEELLAECDPSIPMTEEEREWLDSPAVGRELI